MLEKFGLVETSINFINVGQIFGRLTIVAVGQIQDTYKYYAVCQCSCGSPLKRIRGDGLISGVVISCGCAHKQAIRTHGLTKSGHWHRWRNMMVRCYDESNGAYKSYGGRGISVCPAWHNITNFVADLPSGHFKGAQLDRIDNNGNYEPANVRWATSRVQAGNRRSARLLTHDGCTQSLSEWAKDTGISLKTIHTRLSDGWDVAAALTTPIADRIENMRAVQKIRWAVHTKRQKPPARVLRRFMYNGSMKTIKEISDETGISVVLLRKRICERNWSIEKATSS